MHLIIFLPEITNIKYESAWKYTVLRTTNDYQFRNYMPKPTPQWHFMMKHLFTKNKCFIMKCHCGVGFTIIPAMTPGTMHITLWWAFWHLDCIFVLIYELNPASLFIDAKYGGINSVDRWYAFGMVFHVRWIFLTTSLRIPPESRSDEGGIRRRVVRNPSHMENHTKCIFSHTLHFKAL